MKSLIKLFAALVAIQLGQVAQALPQTLEVYQLQSVLNKANEYAALPADIILGKEGISFNSVDLYLNGALRLAHGDIFTEKISCNGETIPPLDKGAGLLDSGSLFFAGNATTEERLGALSEMGSLVVWTSMHYQAFLDDKGDENALQCQRLKQIRDAFNNLDDLDDVKELRKHLLQKATKAAPNTYVYVPALTTAKAALFRFQENILQNLSNPSSELGALILADVKAGLTAEEIMAKQENRDALLNVVKTQLLQEKGVAAFRFIEALDKNAIDAVHSLSDDVETINAYYEKAKEGYSEIQKAMKDSAVIYQKHKLAYSQVDTYMKSVVKALQSELLNHANRMKDEVANRVDDIVSSAKADVCEKLKSDMSGPQHHWTKRQWGQAPTKDKPLGYRFTATPSSDFTESGRYLVKLEVLVWVPNNGYLISEIANKVELDDPCHQDNVPSYRAIDLGLTINNVYRNGSLDSTSKGFVFVGSLDSGDKKMPIHASAKALEKLGIPGGWTVNQASVTIDGDFQNVSIDYKVDGLDPIGFLKDGVLKFDITGFGLKVCEAIENKYSINAISDWADKANLPISTDWRLSVNTDTNAAIKTTQCKQHFKNLENGTPAPLATSEMAMSAQVDLHGKHRGEPFVWPATVNLSVDPVMPGTDTVVTYKSASFGKVPEVFQKHAEEVTQNLKEKLSGKFQRGGYAISAALGPIGTVDDFRDIKAPLLVEVSTPSCISKAAVAQISFPRGQLATDEKALLNQIEGLLECAGKELIKDAIADVLTCDKLDEMFKRGHSLMGLAETHIKGVPQKTAGRSDQCVVGVEGALFGQKVSIDNILVNLNQGKANFDFSKAKGYESILAPLEAYAKDAAGILADKGVEIKLGKFTKNALPIEVIFKGSNAPINIGETPIGTLMLSTDGTINFDSELDRILKSRIEKLLSNQVTAFAKQYAPKQIIKDTLKVRIEYRDKNIRAESTFDFKFHEDIDPIRASMNLLPDPDVKLVINKALLKGMVANQLAGLLNKALPLKAPGSPIQIQELTYLPTPDMNITFKTGFNIDLDALGTIDVSNVYIGSKGVELQGRLEMRLDLDIILVAAPVPVYLTSPGLYYDFDNKSVGALGGFTVITAELSRFVKIDAELNIGNPRDFLKKMSIVGDLVLMDSLPFVMTEGTLNFAAAQANFKANTSSLFAKVLSAKVDGYMDAKEGLAKLDSNLKVFGVKLSKNKIAINIKSCPKDCITAKMDMILLIGNGSAEVVTGPFLIDGSLKAGIDFKVFSRRFGRAGIQLEALQAQLNARILKLIDLEVVTPHIDDLSPDYLAEIIASLLEVSIEDIKEWLKKPKIKLQPAGSPSSSSKTSPPSDGKGKNKETVHNDPGRQPESEVKEKTPPPLGGGFPKQRSTEEGRFVSACQKLGDSFTWGQAHRWFNNNKFHYHVHYHLDERSFDEICEKQKIKALPGTDAFLIKDTYRSIKTNGWINVNHDEPVCETTEDGKFIECETPYATHFVKYNDPNVKDKNYKERRSNIWSQPRIFRRSPAPGVGGTVPGEVEISIKKKQLSILEDLPETDKERQAELQHIIMDQHGIAVIADENLIIKSSGVSSAILNRFRSKSTVTVHYKKAAALPSLKTSESVHIWASIQGNNQVGKVLLVRQCVPDRVNSKSASNCAIPRGKDWDDQTRKAILDAGARVKDKVDVVLTPSNTSWLLNEAIPMILSNQKAPPLGRTIAVDQRISKCDIRSIQMFDEGDALKFSFDREVAGGAVKTFKIDSLRLPKRGEHKEWLASNDDAFLVPMAHLLACENDRLGWLSKHELWVPPYHNGPKGKTLLFTKRSFANQDYQDVIEVTRQEKPKRYLVQTHNP